MTPNLLEHTQKKDTTWSKPKILKANKSGFTNIEGIAEELPYSDF
jgi:uncharacterized lipoprotein YehR (DUF1307 family)